MYVFQCKSIYCPKNLCLPVPIFIGSRRLPAGTRQTKMPFIICLSQSQFQCLVFTTKYFANQLYEVNSLVLKTNFWNLCPDLQRRHCLPPDKTHFSQEVPTRSKQVSNVYLQWFENIVCVGKSSFSAPDFTF